MNINYCFVSNLMVIEWKFKSQFFLIWVNVVMCLSCVVNDLNNIQYFLATFHRRSEDGQVFNLHHEMQIQHAQSSRKVWHSVYFCSNLHDTSYHTSHHAWNIYRDLILFIWRNVGEARRFLRQSFHIFFCFRFPLSPIMTIFDRLRQSPNKL